MAINFSASFAACLAAGLKVPRQIMYCIAQGKKEKFSHKYHFYEECRGNWHILINELMDCMHGGLSPFLYSCLLRLNQPVIVILFLFIFLVSCLNASFCLVYFLYW